MQVLVGPASASLPACISSSVSASGAQDNNKAVSSSSCLFLNGDDVVGDQITFGSDDSSIGAPGYSEDEDEDDVVSSGEKFSMDSLEESLPIKRGLSNHYSGKSKSFGNLTEVKRIKDLEKEENPFNKRRRLFKKFLIYSRQNPKSTLPDDVEQENDYNDKEDLRQVQEHEQLHVNKLNVNKGFCFADLAEEVDY